MAQSRQLAAIMFTDIVGYTALMGEDEQKAFDLLRKNRQLQKPIIEKFNGTWIKEIGDGVLASFIQLPTQRCVQ
jgi:class 3 adenylate cyclase